MWLTFLIHLNYFVIMEFIELDNQNYKIHYLLQLNHCFKLKVLLLNQLNMNLMTFH